MLSMFRSGRPSYRHVNLLHGGKIRLLFNHRSGQFERVRRRMYGNRMRSQICGNGLLSTFLDGVQAIRSVVGGSRTVSKRHSKKGSRRVSKRSSRKVLFKGIGKRHRSGTSKKKHRISRILMNGGCLQEV
jgi:hypothetical protein